MERERWRDGDAEGGCGRGGVGDDGRGWGQQRKKKRRSRETLFLFFVVSKHQLSSSSSLFLSASKKKTKACSMDPSAARLAVLARQLGAAAAGARQGEAERA